MVGERLWPTYTFKAAGLFFLVAAVLGLLGGIAQINPIWLYGPFKAENVSSASQPDWYMGWLEGSLRLMPNWETRIGWFTIPNQFYSGVLVAGIAFGDHVPVAVDRGPRHQGPARAPRARPPARPAVAHRASASAALTWFTVLGFAGSDDVLAVAFGLSVNALVWTFRVVPVRASPSIVGAITYKLCRELQDRDGPFVDPLLLEDASGPDGSGSDGDGSGGSDGSDGVGRR